MPIDQKNEERRSQEAFQTYNSRGGQGWNWSKLSSK